MNRRSGGSRQSRGEEAVEVDVSLYAIVANFKRFPPAQREIP
jgi:hypothetical protein